MSSVSRAWPFFATSWQACATRKRWPHTAITAAGLPRRSSLAAYAAIGGRPPPSPVARRPRPLARLALGQALELYDTYQKKIDDCDAAIAQHLDQFDKKADRAVIPPERVRYKRGGNAPLLNHREVLFEIAGVDLSQIAGVQPYTVLMFLAETGTDMTRWANAKRFISWLGLCPGTKVSGGKRLAGRTREEKGRAAAILLLAAATLRSSDSALGAFFRRKAAQFGSPKAIMATAHKPARTTHAPPPT